MESVYQHKVLVVDDNEKTREALERILKSENIDPAFAANGEDALKLVLKTDKLFSLIIADQDMGEMTGTQLLEKAKQITPHTFCFCCENYQFIMNG